MGRVRAALLSSSLLISGVVVVASSPARAEEAFVPASEPLGRVTVSLCAFSDDGRHLVWAGPDLATYELLDLERDERSSTPRSISTNSIWLSGDGSTVLEAAFLGSTDSLTVVDLTTGAEETVSDLGFADRGNGRSLTGIASIDADGSEVVWNETSRRLNGEPVYDRMRWTRFDGQVSIIGSSMARTTPYEEPVLHAEFIGAADDGSRAVWVGSIDQIHSLIWTTPAGAVLTHQPLGPYVFEGHVNADASRVLLAGRGFDEHVLVEVRDDGTSRRFDVPVAGPSEFFPDRRPSGSVCAASPDGRHAVSSRTVDGVTTLHLIDLDRAAPRAVTTESVQGPQLADQITRLYQAYFGRTPDTDGLRFWMQRRANGQRLGQISSAFAASAEFASNYGDLDNGAFVDLVYSNVLGRPADPAGRADWVRQLDAGRSRGSVMIGFSESAEFIGSTRTSTPAPATDASINRLYRAYLRRDGDAAGLTYWTDAVERRGRTLVDVSASFAASDEFVEQFGTLGDGAFVDLVYANVLGRAPDAEGRAVWIGHLGRGMSRGRLMVGFSESPEFIMLTNSLPPG